MDPSVQARLDNLAWAAGTVLFIAVGSLLVALAAQAVARARGLSTRERRKVFWGFLFSSPWLLGFAIFVLGPALASLYYSFTDYKLGKSSSWIGLENYRELLAGAGAHGRRFVQALYNSFYYALVGVPLQLAAALGMALLLDREVRGIRLFRLVFYLPVILAGGPAILLAWRYMLAANGGFVNLSLRAFADSFPPFDGLYRLFIFVTEAFNSFYAGVSRGDPLGPLAYALPALVGLAVLAGLQGGWTAAKRGRALRTVEIVGAGLAVTLLARAVAAGSPALAPALLGLGAGATALAFALLPAGRRRARRLLLGAAGALALLAVAWLVPGQLDGGRLGVLARLLALRPSFGPAESLDGLLAFAARSPSALWLWAPVALVPAALVALSGRERSRRVVAAACLVGFALLAVGSGLDGWRYFRAFDLVAAASGQPSYHFTLFRTTVAGFPSADRVPLWLGNELWAKPSLVLITVWSSGAGMLIFLAALKGVPPVFYEAARVDGATPWQSFWRITLPLISPATFYNVVIGLIAALQTFEAVYLIQTPQTEASLSSAAYFLFVRTFRQLEIGQGAAASWILAVVIVLLTAMQFRYSRWVHYEA